MKEYRKRIIDELLELNMEAFGATWIRGPKGCGKTTTARINGEGYIPEYTRTKLTDRLHDVFGFRTDTEIVPTRNMRSIIASTKK